MNKINEILKEALSESKPGEDEIKKINNYLENFRSKLSKSINSMKINAEVFVGGSFAKKTLVKKEKYDVDIFVRFDREYIGKDISEMTSKALEKTNSEVKRIHGSRDYFKIDIEPWLCFEVVPVIKVSKPKDAENITDLSYFHVNYINRRLKGKLLDEIALAKSFCHANNFYGAESHIRGFSGYSLELLIYHYKSFLKFIREMAREKAKDEKIIIDIEKRYKNRGEILMNMNSSKLESPIILIDPTYKQRNALATLSDETFKRFRLTCRIFLKNPNIEFFRIKKVDFDKICRAAEKKGYDCVLLKASTSMQEGAIAGSKLLKFYNHLNSQILRFFDVKEKVFSYEDKKDADYLFIVKKKDKLMVRGPPKNKKEEVKKFRKNHKKTFAKSGRIFAEEKINYGIREFMKEWKEKNYKTVKDMYLSDLKILN